MYGRQRAAVHLGCALGDKEAMALQWVRLAAQQAAALPLRPRDQSRHRLVLGRQVRKVRVLKAETGGGLSLGRLGPAGLAALGPPADVPQSPVRLRLGTWAVSM